MDDGANVHALNCVIAMMSEIAVDCHLIGMKFQLIKSDDGSFGMCYDAHQAVVSYTGFSWAIGFAAYEQKSLGISSPAGKPDVL